MQNNASVISNPISIEPQIWHKSGSYYVILIDNMVEGTIANMKLAAINLLRSLVDETVLSVILCDSIPLKIIEKANKAACESFISSAVASSSSYLIDGYQKAKDLLSKGGTNNGAVVVTSRNIYNDIVEVVDSFTKSGYIFGIFIIYTYEGTLYIHKIRKILTYQFPKFIVLPGLIQKRPMTILDRVKTSYNIVNEIIPKDGIEFKIHFDVTVTDFDQTKHPLGEVFRNVEFDKEWTEINDDIDTYLPAYVNAKSKLRVYAQVYCINCNDGHKTFRMNDYGLSPDSMLDDDTFTTALYCNDLRTLGIYDMKFLLIEIGNKIGKIFGASSFRVKDFSNKCTEDKIPPSLVSMLSGSFVIDTIYCIFVAVGSDGMRGVISNYFVNITKVGSGKYISKQCTIRAQPFDVVCCTIKVTGYKSTDLVYLQIKATDDSKNSNGMSYWNGMSSHLNLEKKCSKTQNNLTSTNFRSNSPVTSVSSIFSKDSSLPPVITTGNSGRDGNRKASDYLSISAYLDDIKIYCAFIILFCIL